MSGVRPKAWMPAPTIWTSVIFDLAPVGLRPGSGWPEGVGLDLAAGGSWEVLEGHLHRQADLQRRGIIDEDTALDDHLAWKLHIADRERLEALLIVGADVGGCLGAEALDRVRPQLALGSEFDAIIERGL